MIMLRRLVFAAVLPGLAGVPFPATGAAVLSPQQQHRAQVNYLLNCAGCHLPDGHGSPGTVPDVREYLGEFAQHDVSRSFLARVPGASGSPLGDAELAEVLNWILITMNGAQLRDDFRPYTAEEVSRYRRDTLIDVEPVRQALIRALAQGAQ
ncbi:MAG: cytochrome c [Gammaproteobacteria bacterium]|nr:cytochrome c [Gammaproteobacteria bacterium]